MLVITIHKIHSTPNRDKPKDKAGREVSTQGKVLAKVVKKAKVTLSKDLKAGREQASHLAKG